MIKQETITADDSSVLASNFARIFGPNFKKVQVAWLSAGNSVGFEIFEFEDPKAEINSNNFEYWKSGFFHFSITDPDIDGLCKKIKDTGGKQRTDILHVNDSKPHHRIAYCEDPFGNIIEIFTYSYEQLNANTENIRASKIPTTNQ
jgi:hypothetical protein